MEVVIAVLLLSIVFIGLSQVYSRGRRQIGYEEDRRKAIAISQARLDGLRHDYGYEGLPALDGSDTTFVVEGRPYVVSHTVAPQTPEDQATTVTVTTTWSAQLPGGGTVARSVEATTIYGRGMP